MPRRERQRRAEREEDVVAPVVVPQGGLDAKLDRILGEMGELRRQNAALRDEMRELRRENELLKRQLAEAKGSVVHDPYATPTTILTRPRTPTRSGAIDADGDVHVGDSPDPKRGKASKTEADVGRDGQQ